MGKDVTRFRPEKPETPGNGIEVFIEIQGTDHNPAPFSLSQRILVDDHVFIISKHLVHNCYMCIQSLNHGAVISTFELIESQGVEYITRFNVRILKWCCNGRFGFLQHLVDKFPANAISHFGIHLTNSNVYNALVEITTLCNRSDGVKGKENCKEVLHNKEYEMQPE